MRIGFALISADGYLTNASGGMEELFHAADGAFFQGMLRKLNPVCVMGRVTHEVTPNKNNRPRFVMTRDPMRPSPDPLVTYISSGEVLSSVLFGEKNVAILGGPQIYDLVGRLPLGTNEVTSQGYHQTGVLNGYDDFYLSVRRDVCLGGGLPFLKSPFSKPELRATMSRWGLRFCSEVSLPKDQVNESDNLRIIRFSHTPIAFSQAKCANCC